MKQITVGIESLSQIPLIGVCNEKLNHQSHVETIRQVELHITSIYRLHCLSPKQALNPNPIQIKKVTQI